METNLTKEPIKAGTFSAAKPEFGRTRDVELSHGLKRGTLYNLHADGKIRGYLLRVRGQKSGVRLWDLASIDSFIRSQATNPTDASVQGQPPRMEHEPGMTTM